MVLTQLSKSRQPYLIGWVSIPLWFLRNLTIPEEICPWIYTVSIPLWFLRNVEDNKARKRHGYKFPYHYGSYATHEKPITVYRAAHVSIPLWFLRNLVPRCWGRGAPCPVSIPLWFLRNEKTSRFSGAQNSVSIPLWFLRN